MASGWAEAWGAGCAARAWAVAPPPWAEPPPPPLKSAVDEAVAALDPDALSPREALEALYRLKGLAGA